jgi:toxin ParE1/3/4
MSYDLVLSPDAKADLKEIANWYENCRTGLGRDLVASVSETINKIQNFPEHHEEIVPGFHRKMIRRFPYSVYYQIRERRIEILVICHNHRDPESWRRQLLGK